MARPAARALLSQAGTTTLCDFLKAGFAVDDDDTGGSVVPFRKTFSTLFGTG